MVHISVHKRLSMIRIGTTDENPEVVVPTAHNMRVCACQDSPVGQGETQAFQCGVAGKYVVILLQKTDVELTLCEVEVFEGNILYWGHKTAVCNSYGRFTHVIANCWQLQKIQNYIHDLLQGLLEYIC